METDQQYTSSNPLFRHPPGINRKRSFPQPVSPVLINSLKEVLEKATKALVARQDAKGFWVFDLEADATIPSEYILLQRFLGRPMEPELRERLARYIRQRQLPGGGWPSYHDAVPDVSASVKAYFALKFSGDSPEAAHMFKARDCILNMGGAAKVNVFTRITLALFGQIPWSAAPVMPIQIMLLPRWFFINLTKVSYWSRTVVVPLLILYSKRPVCKLKPEESIPELFKGPPHRLRRLDNFVSGNLRKNAFILMDRVLNSTSRMTSYLLRKRALKTAEKFVLERMKGEGGIGGIFPAMANAVMALKALGYSKDHPDYKRGIKALDDLLVHDEKESFCQPCVSPIWDTCISLLALQEAGVEPGHPSVSSSVKWLFDQQILVWGDWAHHAPDLEPGGWAFQFENDFYPDVDDTPMVLMAILRAGVMQKMEYKDRIVKAVNWTIGMQSSDEGWGAFDIDNNLTFLNDIPFADHGALVDPSTSDVTGRCIELLGMLGYSGDFSPVQKGLRFLRKEQEDCGAWYGRWGVNYIYGTLSVLMGLNQVGEDMSQPYIRKAVRWLKSCQNPDNGWGETRQTYLDPSLAGKGPSTASQTAWALMGLMAAEEVNDPAVQRGVQYLISNQNQEGGWDEDRFTGTGFPKVFYLRYHGYSHYFPLWALGMYQRLSSGRKTRQDEVKLHKPAKLPLTVFS